MFTKHFLPQQAAVMNQAVAAGLICRALVAWRRDIRGESASPFLPRL